MALMRGARRGRGDSEGGGGVRTHADGLQDSESARGHGSAGSLTPSRSSSQGTTASATVAGVGLAQGSASVYSSELHAESPGQGLADLSLSLTSV